MEQTTKTFQAKKMCHNAWNGDYRWNRHNSTPTKLTAEIEQVAKEEAALVEVLEVWNGAFLEVCSEGLAPTLL